MKNKNKNHKIYLRIFLGMAAAYLGFSAFVNWLVDPFNELNRNTVGLFFSTERQELKNIVNTEHDSILLGTSKIYFINEKEIKYFHFYNAAFPHALPEEMLSFLQKHLSDEKMVIIGLDFYTFNERQFPFDDAQEWPDHFFGKIDYLTSYNVLKSSFIALMKSVEKQKQSFLDDIGTDDYLDDQKKERLRERTNDLDLFKNHFYRRFQFSEKRMATIKSMEAFLNARGTPHVFLISPLHPDVQQLINNTELRSVFYDWKTRLKKILKGHLLDYSNSEYAQRDNFYKDDLLHFKSEVGVEIINKILANHAAFIPASK